MDVGGAECEREEWVEAADDAAEKPVVEGRGGGDAVDDAAVEGAADDAADEDKKEGDAVGNSDTPVLWANRPAVVPDGAPSIFRARPADDDSSRERR